MLFDAVREFVALSGRVGVKGSDPRVKELMVTLRRSGLESPQIAELSGGKWSGTLVRQYTRDWGMVDDSLVKEMDTLIAPLRELVSSGGSVEDVKAALVLDRSVRAKSSSLVEVAELNSNLRGLDMQPGEVGELVKLSREFKEKALTTSGIKGWMVMDKKLTDEGFNTHSRELLLEASKKYGGVLKAFQAFNEFDNLGEILRERTRVEGDVKQLASDVGGLIGEKGRLDLEIGQRRALIGAANAVMVLGFDVGSLSMISVLVKELGGPYKIVEALEKVRPLKEMDDDLKAKKKEISEKVPLLNALRYTLEEAKREYDRNSDVRLVVELLVNPRGIKQDRLEVSRLFARVLESGAQRMEERPGSLQVPSPVWDAALENIKALTNRLRSLEDDSTLGYVEKK